MVQLGRGGWSAEVVCGWACSVQRLAVRACASESPYGRWLVCVRRAGLRKRPGQWPNQAVPSQSHVVLAAERNLRPALTPNLQASAVDIWRVARQTDTSATAAAEAALLAAAASTSATAAAPRRTVADTWRSDLAHWQARVAKVCREVATTYCNNEQEFEREKKKWVTGCTTTGCEGVRGLLVVSLESPIGTSSLCAEPGRVTRELFLAELFLAEDKQRFAW